MQRNATYAQTGQSSADSQPDMLITAVACGNISGDIVETNDEVFLLALLRRA